MTGLAGRAQHDSGVSSRRIAFETAAPLHHRACCVRHLAATDTGVAIVAHGPHPSSSDPKRRHRDYRFDDDLVFEPALLLVAPARAFVVALVFAGFCAPDLVVRVAADFADVRLAAVARVARGLSSPVSFPAIVLALLVTVLRASATALVMREIVLVRFAIELSADVVGTKET